MFLFDTLSLYNFSSISKVEGADLRKVFNSTLVKLKPLDAVTVVTNDDTQTGQIVATLVECFFKPLAYALILLQSEGYPEVFYSDVYRTKMKGKPEAVVYNQLGHPPVIILTLYIHTSLGITTLPLIRFTPPLAYCILIILTAANAFDLQECSIRMPGTWCDSLI